MTNLVWAFVGRVDDATGLEMPIISVEEVLLMYALLIGLEKQIELKAMPFIK